MVTILALGLLTTTCATFKTYQITDLRFPNKTGKLSNGMRVVIQPDDSIPYVVAAIRYDTGAAFDPKDKKGLAHLVEHLAFNLGEELVEVSDEPKSKKMIGRLPVGKKKGFRVFKNKPLKKKGPKKKPALRKVKYLVDENAWTNLDETFYWKEVAPSDLDDVLAKFAEQMGDFTPQITEDIFKTEREVVRNERRSSYEGEPLDRVALDLYDRLYPPEHPYQGQGTIGSHETISSIELADVSAFLRAHYHPGNATLVVLGPVDADETLAKVVKHFGDKPQAEPSKLAVPEWRPTRRRERVVVPEAKDTMITVAWPLPPQYSDEAAAALILRDKGWFHHRLVTNRGWAYWVSSGVRSGTHGSLFVVQALLKDPNKADEAESKILEIADLVSTTVRRQQHIEQQRRRRIYSYLYDAEKPLTRAQSLVRYFSRFGHPISWSRELEQLENMTVAQVREVGDLLDADRAFVMIHTPVEEGRAAEKRDAAEASYKKESAEKKGSTELRHDNRDRLPATFDFAQPFGDFQRWVAEDAERWAKAPEFELDNGLRYRVIQRGSLPLLCVRAAFEGGLLAEPADQHGVAKLMLDTIDLSGSVHREKRYKMGVDYDKRVYDEYVAYGQTFLSVYADQGLALFAEEIQSPRFLRSNVVDSRDAYLQNLGEADRDIDALTKRGFWKARGMEKFSPIATKKTISKVGLAEVEAFHQRIVYPENCLLAVASDLPIEQVKLLVEKHFGDWDETGKSPVNISALAPSTEPGRGGDIVTIEVPDSAQSKLMLGFDAPGWSDWKGLSLASGISRILDGKLSRLRKAMGITYGVQAFTWAWQENGLLGVSTKVEHGATDRALKVLLDVVEDLRTTPLTDVQVDWVKRNLLEDFTDSGHTVDSAANGHIGLMRTHRPRGFKTDSVQWIAELTKSDVQGALDELLAGPPTLVVAGKEPKVPEDRRGSFAGFTGKVKHFTAAELLD